MMDKSSKCGEKLTLCARGGNDFHTDFGKMTGQLAMNQKNECFFKLFNEFFRKLVKILLS